MSWSTALPATSPWLPQTLWGDNSTLMHHTASLRSLPAFMSASSDVPPSAPASRPSSGASAPVARPSPPQPPSPAPRASLLPPFADMVPVMMASSLSGALSRIPCHPLDTIKAKLQALGPNPALYLPSEAGRAASRPSLRSLFSHTLRTEGVRGLYQGFWIAFLGSVPGGFAYFTSYELAKNVFAGVRDATLPDTGASSVFAAPARAIQTLFSVPFALNFTAGLSAEAVSCLVWLPIDVIKERLQVQSLIPDAPAGPAGAPLKYAGTLDAARSILRYEGLRGLYKGYGATLASFGPFSAFYLSSYELFKDSFSSAYLKRSAVAGAPPAAAETAAVVPPWVFFLSGALAGSLASLITNPLDLVKLRIQIQRRAAAAAAAAVAVAPGAAAAAPAPAFGFDYKSTAHGLATVLRQEGPRALLKGASARVAFAAPASAISISLFDTLKQAFAGFGPAQTADAGAH